MFHQLTIKDYHQLWGNGSARSNPATRQAQLWHAGQKVSHMRKIKSYYQLQLQDGTTKTLRDWELVACDK